ncbi:MAG: STAS domain-containing protein [Acidobacteria bacterium]|nr:STAS domain-containing protein [Acidobacteriota bacterium]
MAKLEIAQREAGPGVIVIALKGRLMLGPESADLETLVGTLLDQGIRKIIIDMEGVTHIDSTGIGRCIASLNKCMQKGAKLHMAGAGGQVREAFRVTRLDRMFKFFDQIPDAEAAFA